MNTDDKAKQLALYGQLVAEMQQHYNDGLITIDEALTKVISSAMDLGVVTGILEREQQ